MSHPKQATVGVIGFEIWVETFLDLAGATSLAIKAKPPIGAAKSFTGTLLNKSGPRATTRYGVKYVTAAVGDLDEAGDWEIQAVVTGLGSFTGPGEIAIMIVGKAL